MPAAGRRRPPVHITGATDEDAYFGLGYAVAQDRLFQLHYTKIIYEGRTAEFFGAGPGNVNIQHDRKARQIGWARHADTVARSRQRGVTSVPGFDHYLEARRAEIDVALEAALPGPPGCPRLIVEAMRYSLFAGGKRLRPILTLAAAEAAWLSE